MSPIRFLDQSMLDELCLCAADTTRRRLNLNLHASPSDTVQRFFNALLPDTYVMPHRHLALGKDETLILLRGHLGVLLFDDAGDVLDTHVLSPNGAAFGLTLAPGVWHSVVALDNVVFFEAKAGPYEPLHDDERAPWAPAEQDPACSDYLAWMRSRLPLLDDKADRLATDPKTTQHR